MRKETEGGGEREDTQGEDRNWEEFEWRYAFDFIFFCLKLVNRIGKGGAKCKGVVAISTPADIILNLYLRVLRKDLGTN